MDRRGGKGIFTQITLRSRTGRSTFFRPLGSCFERRSRIVSGRRRIAWERIASGRRRRGRLRALIRRRRDGRRNFERITSVGRRDVSAHSQQFGKPFGRDWRRRARIVTIGRHVITGSQCGRHDQRRWSRIGGRWGRAVWNRHFGRRCGFDGVGTLFGFVWRFRFGDYWQLLALLVILMALIASVGAFAAVGRLGRFVGRAADSSRGLVTGLFLVLFPSSGQVSGLQMLEKESSCSENFSADGLKVGHNHHIQSANNGRRFQ